MNLVFSTLSVKKLYFSSEHSRRVTANHEYISISSQLSFRKWQETGFATSQNCTCIPLPASETINPWWHSLIKQMYLLSIPSYTTQTCFQGKYFRPIYGLSSDLHIQKHVKRNSTIVYISSRKRHLPLQMYIEKLYIFTRKYWKWINKLGRQIQVLRFQAHQAASALWS
jgi:hypothetical protein